MKKPVSAALAAIVLAALLTGCSTNNEGAGDSSSGSSSVENSSSASSSSSAESSSSSSSSESSSGSSADSSSTSSSKPESSSSSSSKPESSSSSSSKPESSSSSSSKPESSSSSSSKPASSSSSSSSSSSTPESSSSSDEESEPEIPKLVDRLEFPENKAGRLAKAGISSNEHWSAMMNIVSDPADLAIFLPDFDVSQCEEHCLIIDMVGINSHELLVAKPKAGSESAVKAAFDARFDFIKDPSRFLYPAGFESVAGAVQGETDDGYLYIVVHQDGKDIEAAIQSAK